MNRFMAGLAVSAFALAGAPVASAADLTATPVAAALACDFFEAELIGYLCARTAFVGVSGSAYSLVNTRSTPIPGGVSNFKFQTRQSYEGTTVSITPWEGFRVTVGDEAFQYKNTQTQQNVLNAGPPQPMFTGSASGSQGGWLHVGAEYTLWDRRNEWGRFLTTIVVDFEHFEGGGPYQARDLQQVGWNSGAKFTLGASNFSLDYFGNTLLQHFDSPGETRLSSYSRVLLANDVWGVGVGPRLQSVNELWHAAGVNTGWSSTSVGGEILLEPFRLTPIAFLKDLTVDGYYQHSIGQAGLVPKWNGTATAYDYGGSARFNFRF